MATRLGPRYRHVQTSFSTAAMTAHAVTLNVELRRPGDAMRIAHSFDPNRIPSLARRSRHLIEVARAHHQRDDRAGTYALLTPPSTPPRRPSVSTATPATYCSPSPLTRPAGYATRCARSVSGSGSNRSNPVRVRNLPS